MRRLKRIMVVVVGLLVGIVAVLASVVYWGAKRGLTSGTKLPLHRSPSAMTPPRSSGGTTSPPA